MTTQDHRMEGNPAEEMTSSLSLATPTVVRVCMRSECFDKCESTQDCEYKLPAIFLHLFTVLAWHFECDLCLTLAIVHTCGI